VSKQFTVQYPYGPKTWTVYCRLCSGDEYGLCHWCWETGQQVKPLADALGTLVEATKLYATARSAV
jgi:hypothetical protein